MNRCGCRGRQVHKRYRGYKPLPQGSFSVLDLCKILELLGHCEPARLETSPTEGGCPNLVSPFPVPTVAS